MNEALNAAYRRVFHLQSGGGMRTAGPGVTRLCKGFVDARKEGAPVIAIAVVVETSTIDTDALKG